MSNAKLTLCLALLSVASASSILARGKAELASRATSLLPYTLPSHNGNLTLRDADIAVKRTTWLYAPAVGGVGPYSPGGALGLASLTADTLIPVAELAAEELVSRNDSVVAGLNDVRLKIVFIAPAYGIADTVPSTTVLILSRTTPSSTMTNGNQARSPPVNYPAS